MKKPISIAVVEDRPEDRFFLGHALSEAFPDCMIKEFSYAENALAYLRSPDRPQLDLIIVDISMPRMDGFEFADAFSELYPELRSKAKLYIMSSSIDPKDHSRAAEHLSVAGFLEKPPSIPALKALLA